MVKRAYNTGSTDGYIESLEKKNAKLEQIKPQPMGTIEIGYKFDEFKIRLRILNLQDSFVDSNSGQRLIKKKLRELEKEFNEFIKTIHSPTVLNSKEKELCLS